MGQNKQNKKGEIKDKRIEKKQKKTKQGQRFRNKRLTEGINKKRLYSVRIKQAIKVRIIKLKFIVACKICVQDLRARFTL
jgi:hypothetical protein